MIDATAGSNAIYNWHSGDQIRLLGSSLPTFAAVQAAMTQQGADVVLQNGQDHLVIRNTTISQFTASDFNLALNPALLGAQTFADDFNALNLRSAANPNGTWATDYGYGGLGSYTLTGNGELQIYAAPGFQGTSGGDLGLNPFSVSNGILDIHAQTVDAATSANIWNYGYTSGAITTKQSFSQTYGYFEMRAELPTNGAGAWPAFWLVPANGSWPPELDVMETLSGSPQVDYTTVHSQATGAHTAVGSANFVPEVGGFHTYGVLWTPTQLIWYVDGQQVFETATPADMNQPMYMIANLAIGGWAGAPQFTSADMQIDYIHAYALAGDLATGSTGAATTTTTTGAGGGTSTTTTTPAGSSTVLSIADAAYTAAAGVTGITLTGSSQSIHANDLGDTIVSNNSANHLYGGAGNDTFVLGRGGDIATGGGGADTFVFNETPWAAGHITDFSGTDVVDLSGMFSRYGYTGTDPIADGRLTLVSDGQGGTQVWFNMDGLPSGSGSWLVTTLDGITPANLKYENGRILDPPASAPPSANGAPVSTSSASYSAPAGVTNINLTGSGQTVTGNDLGDTFTSNNGGNHLTGGSGADTVILGRGGDVAAGGGGADTFVFNETPWAAGHITDFTPGQDTIDLTGLLAHSGYAGANAIAADYLKITADSAGNAQVWSNLDQVSPGAGWWLVTTLDGVNPSTIQLQGNVVQGVAAVVPASTLGETFTSDNAGNHLTGGSGADTFILGRGGDVAAGGGGADTFVFNETPWAAGHITDFTPGQDTIDLTGLLSHSGYAGANAIADGYLKITADSAGNAQIWSDLDHVSPGAGWWLVTTLDGVSPSTIQLQGNVVQGAVAPVSTSPPGQTFTSDNAGNHLVGASGADTFVLGRGGDVVTGGGGADTFVFNETPWAAGHITDFTPGQDTIDLTGLLTHSGYAGADAIAAGYLKITADTAGNAQIWSDLDQVSPGAGWWLVTTLDGVATSDVHLHGAFISG